MYDAQLAVDLVGKTYARAFELRRRFPGDVHDADARSPAGSSKAGANDLNEELPRGAVERRALRRAGFRRRRSPVTSSSGSRSWRRWASCAPPSPGKAVGRGDLPAGMRGFVGALDGAREVRW
jgi:hypothetical protein